MIGGDRKMGWELPASCRWSEQGYAGALPSWCCLPCLLLPCGSWLGDGVGRNQEVFRDEPKQCSTAAFCHQWDKNPLLPITIASGPSGHTVLYSWPCGTYYSMGRPGLGVPSVPNLGSSSTLDTASALKPQFIIVVIHVNW